MKTHKNTSSKMFGSKSSLGALVSAGAVVAALAFSGCSSNKSESASGKILSSSEVISLMKTPLTEATSITLATEYGQTGYDASVTVRRDASGDFEFKTEGDTSRDLVANIVVASGRTYAQFQDDALKDIEGLEGLASDEWVLLGTDDFLDESDISWEVIDNAVTGSESVSDGLYQLGDSLDSNYEGWDQYVVLSNNKTLSGDVLYDLAPSATETVALQVGVDSNGRLSFVGLDQEDGTWTTTLKVTYDESDVVTPAKVSDIAPSVVQEALMNAATSDMAQNAALSFDRQIRSQAAFGIDGNPNDTDPRRSQLLIDMISSNGAGMIIIDIPDSATASSVLENSQLRVLVWQGSGAASVKWTRLFCEPSVCQNVVSEQLLSSVGENGKLFNPSVRQEMCIQFHRFGKDAWLRLSTQANQQGVVSTVLEEACPSSSFPGIVAATGTTYADLAVSSTGPATDSSW